MLAINANTKHPDAAWKLVAFLTAGAVHRLLHDPVPGAASLLKAIEFGRRAEGFAEQLTTTPAPGAPMPSGPVPIGAMWNAIGRAFGTALSGQKSPEEAGRALDASAS